MEYLLNIVNDLPVLMVVFSRVGGMLLFAPVFGNANVPLQVRVAIALMFTFILYPSVDKTAFTLPSSIILYTFVVLKEIAIGAVVGFAASIIFGAFTAAGYLISNQMGLDTASIVDPTSEIGEEEQAISIFYNMIAVLISTAQSFEMIPLGSFKYTTMTLTKILIMFKSFLVMGIKISAPSLVVLLLTVVVLGLMTKVAQEINVFIIAFPVKILIGFLILIIALPFVMNAMKSHLIPFEKDMVSLLFAMRE